MADSNDLELPSLQKLQSAEQLELLNVVDSLRAYGLSEIVALPQLIVCGDQSSGKSSVLEAISGIPFPHQETLCTRFATEVILRRSAKEEINASIVPAHGRAVVDRDKLLRFHREPKTKGDFENLFKDARDEMGLSSSGRSFSNDILRVELCGPSQPQLTLVDLPGLIHFSETNSKTTGDVELVHNLVSGYLGSARSIILAVVSAKNDLNNQIILRNARKVDPQGLRTLGIITKPDLLIKGSKSEEAFIALARNEEVKFSLGWHVVKNLDSAKTQNQQDSRDQQETLFFEESNFNRLPARDVGISSLRARLSKVLFDQIRSELPGLVKDIQKKISTARIARDKLGPSRSKPEQQREFLITLSQTFQTICRDAVRGDYDHEFFQADTNPGRRLCANVMNMHFSFASNLRKNGASWIIDVEDYTGEKRRSRDEAIKEACKLLKRSRGRELPGLPNPLLVGELFRQYSRPWGDLAREHIKNVWETTNKFLELLLRHLANEEVCENISRFWLYPAMEEKLNLAYSKLDELLEVHRDYPMTTNSDFITNSRASRRDSRKQDLGSLLKSRLQSGQAVQADEITQIISSAATKADLDMDMVAAEEAFDNMNAYYEVAMNLFTDNVPTLAVHAPIIRGVPNIFCPTSVFSMDTDTVNKIAGESKETIEDRESILRRLAALEEGARICKQKAKPPRHVLEPSSNDIDPSESPPSAFKTPVKSGTNTPAKTLSTAKQSPTYVLKTGNPSISTTGDDKVPSPNPESMKPTPPVFNWQATKPADSGTASTKPSGGLFAPPTGSSSVNLFGMPSPKPPYVGLFSSKTSTTAGTGLFANLATKNTSGDTGSTIPSFSFGTAKSTASSSALTPAPALEGTSGDATSNTATGGSGLFAGIAPAKNVNSLNKVPDKD
ncbi:P-loop containing nucleoside triphosphate hydrolase protein [Hyaloscypha variabilis]